MQPGRLRKGVTDMRTLAEIKQALHEADREAYEAMARALAADERKGVKQALASTLRRLDAQDAERARLEGMYAFQREFCGSGLVAGLDEVGRGPVAGPLTVAAVVLPDNPFIEGLNDSKQISPEKRERIAKEVKKIALAWDIEHVAPTFIDEHGMSASLRMAFSRAVSAVEGQGVALGCVLLDGNPLGIDPRERNVVKGDAKCASIAAASVIAKVERDALMCEYAEQFPGYGFESNKGYASAEHISAILELGLSPLHRASFCRAWTQESLF